MPDLIAFGSIAGLVVMAVMLFVAFVKWINNGKNPGGWVIAAFVSSQIIYWGCVLISQVAKFGFVGGILGIIIGVLFVLWIFGVFRFF